MGMVRANIALAISFVSSRAPSSSYRPRSDSLFKVARDPENVVGDYFVGRLPFDFTYECTVTMESCVSFEDSFAASQPAVGRHAPYP